MLGHVPISSLQLNASLYLYGISITSFFSSSVKHVLYRFIYFSNISLYDIHFLSSILSNHGCFSPASIFSSFFKVLIKLLNQSHTFSVDLNCKICLSSVVTLHVIFYTNLKFSNLKFLMLPLGLI